MWILAEVEYGWIKANVRRELGAEQSGYGGEGLGYLFVYEWTGLGGGGFFFLFLLLVREFVHWLRRCREIRAVNSRSNGTRE